MSQPCHPGKWQLQPDTQILQSGATPDSHTLHLNRQKTWLAHLAPKRAEDLIASKYDTSRTHSTPHHLHGYSSSPSLRTQVPSLSWAVVSGLPASPLAFLCPQLQSLLQGSKLSLIKSMVILCSLDHTTPCSKPLAEFLNDPTNCLCLISYHVPSMGQLWHFHSKTYFHPRSFFWVVPCASNVVLQNICMIQSLAFLFLFKCYPSDRPPLLILNNRATLPFPQYIFIICLPLTIFISLRTRTVSYHGFILFILWCHSRQWIFAE